MGALLSLPLLAIPSMSTVRVTLPCDSPNMLFWGANDSRSCLPSERHVVELPLVRPFVVLAANFRAGPLFPKNRYSIFHRD